MPEEVVMAIVMVTFILTTGSVLILRPSLKHFFKILEMHLQERRTQREHLVKTQELLLEVEQRLTHLEEQRHYLETAISINQSSPKH